MQNELASVTKKSGLVFTGQIIGYLFEFIYIWVITRLIGVQYYGRFVYIFSIINFLTIFCKFGLDNGLMYMIPRLTVDRKLKERNGLISVTLATGLVIAIFFVIAFVLSSKFISIRILHNTSQQMVLISMAPLLAFLILSDLAKGVLRGIGDIKYFVSGDLVYSITKIVIVFLLQRMGLKFAAIIDAVYIGLMIECGFFLVILYRVGALGKINQRSVSLLRETLSFSYPLILTGIVLFVMQKTDIFMIGYLMGEKQVGIYNIALKIGTASSFMLSAVNVVFAPVISKLHHQGELQTLKEIYTQTTKWITSLNLLIFAFIVLFSRELLQIFGTAAAQASMALVLVAVGQVVNAGVGSAGLLTTMTGKPKITMYLNCVALLFNVGLNYLLISKCGINGAAFASLVSVALVNILRLSMIYKYLKIHPYDSSYFIIIAAVIISAVIVFFFKQIILIQGIMGLIVFLSLLTIVDILINLVFGISEVEKELVWKVISFLKQLNRNQKET